MAYSRRKSRSNEILLIIMMTMMTMNHILINIPDLDVNASVTLT